MGYTLFNSKFLLGFHYLSKFLLIAVVLILPMSDQQFVYAAMDQHEVEQQLEKIQAQIVKSQRKLESDRNEFFQLENKLSQSEKTIGKLNQQLTDTKNDLKVSQKKIQSLNIQKQKLQSQLLKHNKLLYAQIRSEYFYGGQQRLKMLLNQQQPTKLGRDLVFYDYIHKARLNEIQQATTILKELNSVHEKLDVEQNISNQTQSRLLSQKEKIVEQQKQRKAVIASLNTNISSEEKKLSRLEKDEKQLKEIINELQNALANLPGIDSDQKFGEYKGKLYWPVVGKPRNKFGKKRNSATSKLIWNGVFISSKEGNNVRSIFHGRVAFAEWMRGLGLLIIIDHGNGYMSLYGHNQSIYKHTGEWVNAGERIATVGDSGGNAKTGLYFEIRKQGKPVNPALWCTKPASSRKLAG